jgi:quinol-cytochrome oxidoreductase complex cytochrome b subunit
VDEKNKQYEAGFGSDAAKNPQRIVFLTRKTSAKVSGEPGPQVMAYPHVLVREAIAFEALVIVMVLVALVWDAPLEQLANPLVTPNPAKAPWYFLGLQELLHYFPPFVAGILIPTLVIIALVIIPYFNVNIEGEPVWAHNRTRRLQIFLAVFAALAILLLSPAEKAWTVLVPSAAVGGLLLYSYYLPAEATGWKGRLSARPVSWWVMTWFITVALVLTLVGTFFRGPGWSWVWPWRGHAG